MIVRLITDGNIFSLMLSIGLIDQRGNYPLYCQLLTPIILSDMMGTIVENVPGNCWEIDIDITKFSEQELSNFRCKWGF